MENFGYILNYGMPKNEWGQIILFEKKKNPQSHVYSDRLFSWNPKKYNDLHEKHFGNQSQYWDNVKPSKIQDFLSDYLGTSVTLQRILRGENQSSGYPYWVFGYDLSEKA